MYIVAAMHHENTPRSAGTLNIYPQADQSHTYAGEEGLSLFGDPGCTSSKLCLID